MLTEFSEKSWNKKKTGHWRRMGKQEAPCKGTKAGKCWRERDCCRWTHTKPGRPDTKKLCSTHQISRS